MLQVKWYLQGLKSSLSQIFYMEDLIETGQNLRDKSLGLEGTAREGS